MVWGLWPKLKCLHAVIFCFCFTSQWSCLYLIMLHVVIVFLSGKEFTL